MANGIKPSNPALRFLGRHQKTTRRTLSGLSVLLILGAIGLLGYPFYTNLYQDYLQGKLRHQLASPSIRQEYRSHTIAVGASLTRLKIPAIGVDVVVVEGTTASALRAGAGHYPETPLPCELGNVGIAGHRTTYGKPFNQIDRLKTGDPIILETPVGSCTYKVSKDPFVVAPDDFSVVAPPPDATSRWLTLTSCHPKGSASHRIVIRATFVSASQSTA